jgi:hypothetical protein
MLLEQLPWLMEVLDQPVLVLRVITLDLDGTSVVSSPIVPAQATPANQLVQVAQLSNDVLVR